MSSLSSMRVPSFFYKMPQYSYWTNIWLSRAVKILKLESWGYNTETQFIWLRSRWKLLGCWRHSRVSFLASSKYFWRSSKSMVSKIVRCKRLSTRPISSRDWATVSCVKIIIYINTETPIKSFDKKLQTLYLIIYNIKQVNFQGKDATIVLKFKNEWKSSLLLFLS